MTRRPRVVDFSTHLSGPMASHLLAELGADVLKVENPRTGDGNRGLEPLIGGRGLFHHQLNAGTRSLAVSTRSPHWGKVVAACASWADAVIVGSRPVDAERRGLDFASLVRHNPELVYCSISGFGDNGPWRDLPAHGQTIDALAGLLPVVDDADGYPTTPPGWRSTGATLAGAFGALGVFAGLHRRATAGGPQLVTLSLWGSAMWWSWRDLVAVANTGERWYDYGDLGTRYAMYYTSDQRVLLVCPIEQRFWARFCEELELPAAWAEFGSWGATGMEFGRGEAFAHERPAIADRLATRTFEEWTEVLHRLEIPFAPVLTIEEALGSEHAAAAGVMRAATVAGRPSSIAACPVRLAGVEVDGSLRAPEIGEDTDDLLVEIGLGELAAEDLRRAS